MLAVGVAPHESTKDNKVAGYGAIWHNTTYDNWKLDVPGEGDHASPYTGRGIGLTVGPDRIHEINHNEKCRRAHSGLSGCFDIAGVNLTPHEQDHSKKPVHFRSVNTMNFPNFTYSLRVINEIQNEQYNKRTLGRLLEAIDGHPEGRVSACREALWTCGRCFCANPVVRVFDCFGRVDIIFLSAVLSA